MTESNQSAILPGSPVGALLEAIRDALAIPYPRTVNDAAAYLDERCNRATEVLLQVERVLGGADDADAIEWGTGYLRRQCELYEAKRTYRAAPDRGPER
jgi:hypothetical protein